MERIIEYERVRSMAVAIGELPLLERDVYCIGRGSLEKEADFDLLCLCNLYFELMNVKEESYFVVRDVKPTLEEKIAALKDLLRSDGFFEWDIAAGRKGTSAWPPSSGCGAGQDTGGDADTAAPFW